MLKNYHHFKYNTLDNDACLQASYNQKLRIDGVLYPAWVQTNSVRATVNKPTGYSYDFTQIPHPLLASGNCDIERHNEMGRYGMASKLTGNHPRMLETQEKNTKT